MPATTWSIRGVDTGGENLALSYVQPWAQDGAKTPTGVTATFPPISGSVSDLLADDTAVCVFAAADVLKPGFSIDFTFAEPVDLWGFRFAGPSDKTWPLQHTLTASTASCTLGRVLWTDFTLSPAPTKRPSFATTTGTWVAQTAAGSRDWRGCAVSADGQTIAGGVYNGNMWLSKDGGTTWVAQTAVGIRDWYGCAVSADGQTIVGSAASNNLWLSKDGGTTWVAQTAAGSRDWRGCAVSADGQTIVGAAYGSDLLTFTYGDPIYLANAPRTESLGSQLYVRGLTPASQGSLAIPTVESVQVLDIEFGGQHKVYGTVERKNEPANTPLRRRVRLHRSRDGMLVRETWSKSDGTYEFLHITDRYEYDTVAWDHEMLQRSVIANNLKPEPM